MVTKAAKSTGMTWEAMASRQSDVRTRMSRARRPASERPDTGGGDKLVDRVSAGRVVVVHFGRK